MKNRIIRLLTIVLCLLSCLSGCGRTEEEQLLLLEEGVSDNQTFVKELPPNEDLYEEEPSMITVHVCGAVTAPGVYELKSPARVVEAIVAAGSFDADAAEVYLNLASLLTDGQQVYVPTKQEAEQMSKLLVDADAGIASTQASASEAKNTNININTASKEELMNLPGIGEAKAESVLHYRESSGGFRKIEDIMKVEGIKEGLFYKIQGRISVGP